MSELKSLEMIVVSGGTSAERPYNICAGQSVCTALEANGVAVTALELGTSRASDAEIVAVLAERRPSFVFLCVTEEVPIQGALDLLGIPYNGSGPAASLLTLDKLLAGSALAREGLQVPPQVYVSGSGERRTAHWHHRLHAHVLSRASCEALVVKPRASGCSLGVSVVRDPSADELRDAVAHAEQFSTDVMIEEFVEGAEITVGVIGDLILPPVRPSEVSGIYSSGLKWDHAQPGPLGTSCAPAPRRFTGLNMDALAETVDRARRALGLRNAWRMDLVVSPSEIVVLEVNALPKLASPYGEMCVAARHFGMDYIELLTAIADDALRAFSPV